MSPSAEGPEAASRPKASSYAAAGVDIDAAEETISRFKAAVEATHGPEVLSGIGHFGGLFAPDMAGMQRPVLVSGTDSVGTKLKIAIAADKHDTVGFDLVAMSLNDVLVLGARPLFFLDCLSVGQVRPERDAAIVEGIARACEVGECALIGGELAELPGLFPPDEYDIVGFCVGLVDQPKIIDGSRIEEGDVIVGLASSGLHSNGFSLARKVVFEQAGLKLDDEMPGCGRSVVEELLEPTLIYTKPLRMLAEVVEVRGLANITGGGLYDNVPRVLPDELCADLDRTSWPRPPVFDTIREAGEISIEEMHRVFNMGIGMVAVARAEDAAAAIGALEEAGTRAYTIGSIRGRSGQEPKLRLR